MRWKQGARDSWGLRGDRVRTESGARMVVAATCRKATQEYTAGMQEGREGAWLPLRAETAGKQPGGGHAGGQYPPPATLTCLLPHSTIQARAASSYLENSSKGAVSL